MKLVLITLLLLTASCSLVPNKTPNHARNLMDCMERFAEIGFSSEAITKLCNSAFERRD